MRNNQGITRVLFVLFAVIGMAVLHSAPAYAHCDGMHAFADPIRVIAEDLAHSKTEKRFFCFGEDDGGILTVRFTYRGVVI